MVKQVKYKRNCPKCNVELFYKVEGSKKHASKKNTLCRRCVRLGQNNHTVDGLEKIRLANIGNKNHLGHKHTKETKKSISEKNKGRTVSVEVRKRISGTLKQPLIVGVEKIYINGEYRWKRKCPNKSNFHECNKYIFYTNRNNATYAELDGRECIFCANNRKDVIKKTIETKMNISYGDYISNIDNKKYYYNNVKVISEKQPIHLLENYEKRGRAGIIGAFHLDHKYSISEGFKNKIPAEIIGNINNLEFISWEDNYRKRDKCSISIEDIKYV